MSTAWIPTIRASTRRSAGWKSRCDVRAALTARPVSPSSSGRRSGPRSRRPRRSARRRRVPDRVPGTSVLCSSSSRSGPRSRRPWRSVRRGGVDGVTGPRRGPDPAGRAASGHRAVGGGRAPRRRRFGSVLAPTVVIVGVIGVQCDGVHVSAGTASRPSRSCTSSSRTSCSCHASCGEPSMSPRRSRSSPAWSAARCPASSVRCWPSRRRRPSSSSAARWSCRARRLPEHLRLPGRVRGATPGVTNDPS